MTGIPLLAALTLACAVWGADTTTRNQNITILSGQVSTDGKTEVRERVLEECIAGLPQPQELEPVIASDARFLKEINGVAGRNEFVKVYSASVEISYMLYQKVLFIVTSTGVPAQAPLMKEMEKNIRQTQRFESAPANGDLFAGRSMREYYFSTPEKAAEDARKKAESWLKQQVSVLCKRGGAK